MAKPTTHSWVIDGIEEDTVRVEEDGTRMRTVPKDLLPAGAREGQVLKVERDATAANRLSLVITVDEQATTAALERSRVTTQAASAASRKRDPGGDVTL